MKKYSTNYLEWTALLFLDLFVVGVLIFATNFGLSYQKKYNLDFSGYGVTVIAVIVLGLFLWETIVVIDFLIKNVRGHVTIDEEKMTIIKGTKEEIYNFKDLLGIELSGPRTGSRSITTSLTYCKVIFKNKTIFLTSLTMHNIDIMKNLGRQVSKTKNRERRFFELIK